jgi:hypothetical protein
LLPGHAAPSRKRIVGVFEIEIPQRFSKRPDMHALHTRRISPAR